MWILLIALLPAVVADGGVTVAIDPNPRSCAVQGRFHAAVPAALAWEVLADYDHIPRFVHSMVSSHSERTPDGRLRVTQTARVGMFIFHRHLNVVLEVDEDPGRRIGFRDVLGQDFEHYAGEWRIERDSTGTSVRYALEAEPRGSVARSLCRGQMRHTAEDLLEEVREEMRRRAAAAADSSMPKP